MYSLLYLWLAAHFGWTLSINEEYSPLLQLSDTSLLRRLWDKEIASKTVVLTDFFDASIWSHTMSYWLYARFLVLSSAKKLFISFQYTISCDDFLHRSWRTVIVSRGQKTGVAVFLARVPGPTTSKQFAPHVFPLRFLWIVAQKTSFVIILTAQMFQNFEKPNHQVC